MKNIKHVYDENLYTDGAEVYINTRQLNKFLLVMCQLDAFSNVDRDVEEYQLTAEYDLGFFGLVYDEDLDVKHITIGGQRYGSDSKNSEKTVFLTDYPDSIKAIFGLDYEHFVPAACENMIIRVYASYEHTNGYYSPATYYEPEEYGDPEIQDFEIDKVEIMWTNGAGGKVQDTEDITEELNNNVMDWLTDIVYSDNESVIYDKIADR